MQNVPPPSRSHLPLTQHVQDQRTIFELGREYQTDLCPFSSFLIISSLSLPFSTKGPHSFLRAGSREGITVQVVSGTKYGRCVHRAWFS